VGKCAPDIVGRVGKVVDLTALVATFPQSTELVLHYLPCLDKAPVLNNIPAAVECAFQAILARRLEGQGGQDGNRSVDVCRDDSMDSMDSMDSAVVGRV
jgi:hypothetical protein